MSVVALRTLGWPDAATADSATPTSLLQRAFDNLYADDYVQTLVLTTRAQGARDVSRTLQITRKQSANPGKALVRFLEPYDIRHTSILMIERNQAADDLFVYLPALGLTRRLSAAQRADSFFGTDLSYEDIEPKYARDYEVRDTDEDAANAGCQTLEIHARPPFESTYDRMVLCIEPTRAVINWTAFYRNGELVKRLEIDSSQVKKVGRRFIPYAMTMRTQRTGSETRVETKQYDLMPGIPDDLFSTWNLEAGSAERDRSRAEAAGE